MKKRRRERERCSESERDGQLKTLLGLYKERPMEEPTNFQENSGTTMLGDIGKIKMTSISVNSEKQFEFFDPSSKCFVK